MTTTGTATDMPIRCSCSTPDPVRTTPTTATSSGRTCSIFQTATMVRQHTSTAYMLTHTPALASSTDMAQRTVWAPSATSSHTASAILTSTTPHTAAATVWTRGTSSIRDATTATDSAPPTSPDTNDGWQDGQLPWSSRPTPS